MKLSQVRMAFCSVWPTVTVVRPSASVVWLGPFAPTHRLGSRVTPSATCSPPWPRPLGTWLCAARAAARAAAWALLIASRVAAARAKAAMARWLALLA
ncbi:hypothetical protein D3C73_653000 [compost metagenome]